MAPTFALALLAASSLAFADAKDAASSDEFAQFVSTVKTDGKENHIRPNVGAVLGLVPNAPSKAFVIDIVKEEKGVKLGRACNVVKADDTVVFLNHTRKNRRNVGRYFISSPDGRLLSASEIVSANDAEGKPVRGSGKTSKLNIASASTKKAFKEELKFWLSGEYKKHLLQSK